MIREVMTSLGAVRGIPAADPRITAFKGIPFAAPPVGERRFKAPEPAQAWEGVRDCARFAPIAMQEVPGLGNDIYCREWHVDPETPMGEDCLYLNVWTSAKSGEDRLPVLVWFFGGGLQCGYPSEMEFDGERLARRGIVVVSVNYRVGVFGFLCHEELSRENPMSRGNMGSRDQQMGLLWVRDNIAAFGGDPDRVTIAGQSAGGGSVLTQMVCPENKGLFRGAVIMSAFIRSPYQAPETASFVAPRSMKEAEAIGADFFRFLGVNSLAEARELPATEIQESYNQFVKSHPIMLNVVDGRFQPGDPIKLMAAGRAMDIPVIAGNTDSEFPDMLPEPAEKAAAEIFGDEAEAFLAFPEAHAEAEYRGAHGYAPVSGIEFTAKYAFLGADRAGSGAPHYYYRFMPDIPGWDDPKTFHSSDLWFWFETLAKCWRPFVGRHYDLARMMANYFANFVKTGDPNGNDADGTPMPEWEPYAENCRAEMNFTGDGPCVSKEKEFMRFLVRTGSRRLSFPQLREPLWRTGTMVKETGTALEGEDIPLLFSPEEVIRVESYDGSVRYEEGEDYVLRDGALHVLRDGKIPEITWGELVFASKEEAEREAAALPYPWDPGIVPVTTGGFLSLRYIGHPDRLTRATLLVTYRTAESWSGPVPEPALDFLPELKAKVARGETVKIAIYGDSITCGFDASGMYGQRPWTPVLEEQLAQSLRENWKTAVFVRNVSFGGMNTDWAVENAAESFARAGYGKDAARPDLVILGYGMNDRCPGPEYEEKTRRLIGAVREILPGQELMLVATSLPNSLAATPPEHFAAHQDEYAESLANIAADTAGTVVADVQGVQKYLMKRKRYIDLTGNWLNHPNDYLVRVQAQVMAAVLSGEN